MSDEATATGRLPTPPNGSLLRLPPPTLDVRAPDGRVMAVNEWGAPLGHPVFVLHGTPGSRLGVAPRPMVLYHQGIRLIAYDRPGYGGSDRQIGRRIVDAAEDVRAIADHLGIERFAVVGRSGGGPHALACAARLPGRVTRAAALVSVAPRIGPEGMTDARWYRDMGEMNQADYRAAQRGLDAVSEQLLPRAGRIGADPDVLLNDVRRDAQASDLRVISDAGIRRVLKQSYREAMRQWGAGWCDDAIALVGDWGFRLADIKAPVQLWHGQKDTFSPSGHSAWLAGHIPDAVLRAEPEKAHFDAFTELPGILTWLTRPAAPGSGRPGTAARI
jgi:pimeloyl-ACP methyl ester carboxylesterase